ELRATPYLASGQRASAFGDAALDNCGYLDLILALRGEVASLLGVDSYADYTIATKMARDPADVLAFLRDLAARAKPFAERDRGELEQFARGNLGLETLQAWDLAYAADKLKQARYSYSEQDVKQYFTEPKVLGGLFSVIEQLYGLRVQPDIAPVWHPDVRFFRLVDANEQLVGQFYL